LAECNFKNVDKRLKDFNQQISLDQKVISYFR